jgi:alginate O-acetyltransferase complex protein AlgI
MSLSRFLRDYLYIPLGGNRKGLLRRYGNLMITMIIGGLWHGANWTFAMWGALHGIYLVIHHTWRYLTAHYSWAQSRRLNPLKWMLTFLAVLVGWVFFRSRTFDEAIFVLRGMAGLNGVLLPDNIKPLFAKALHPLGVVFGNTSVSPMCYVWILALIPIVFFSPNSQEIFQLAEPGQGQITISRALWKPTVFWGCLCGALFALACMRMRTVHEFIYFQF